MREEGIILKDQSSSPVLRRKSGYISPCQNQLPFIGLFQTRYHSKYCRFSTPRWPEQRNTFTMFDRKRYISYSSHAAIGFTQAIKYEMSHGIFLTTKTL